MSISEALPLDPLDRVKGQLQLIIDEQYHTYFSPHQLPSVGLARDPCTQTMALESITIASYS